MTDFAKHDRDALLYSDGSLGIFTDGYPMENIKEERVSVDRNEEDPAHLTKIVRVRFEVIEVLFDPTTQAPPPPPAPSVETEQLRAEVERLRAELAAVNAKPGTRRARKAA